MSPNLDFSTYGGDGADDFEDFELEEEHDHETFDPVPVPVLPRPVAIDYAVSEADVYAGKPLKGTLWRHGQGGDGPEFVTELDGSKRQTIGYVHREFEAGSYLYRTTDATGSEAKIEIEVTGSARTPNAPAPHAGAPSITADDADKIRNRIRSEERSAAREEYARDRRRYENEIEAFEGRIRRANDAVDEANKRVRDRDDELAATRARMVEIQSELARIKASEGLASMQAVVSATDERLRMREEHFTELEKGRDRERRLKSEIDELKVRLQHEHPEAYDDVDKWFDRIGAIAEQAGPLLSGIIERRATPSLDSDTELAGPHETAPPTEPHEADVQTHAAHTPASVASSPTPTASTPTASPMNTINQFVAGLLPTALRAATDEYAVTPEQFAQWVGECIADVQGAGVTFDANGWRILANTLVMRAAEAGAKPERVASLVAPLVQFVSDDVRPVIQHTLSMPGPTSLLFAGLRALGWTVPNEARAYVETVLGHLREIARGAATDTVVA